MAKNSYAKRLHSALRDWPWNRRGNFAVLLAISTIPLVVGLGGIIDYAQSEKTRSKLQDASDGAVIAAALANPNLTDAEIETTANVWFSANYGENLKGTVTRNDDEISFSVSTTFLYSFLPLLHINETRISVKSYAKAAAQDIDVVLILDNSLSMSGSKRLVELKKAALLFISDLEGISSKVQISVIPFDDTVFAGPGIVSRDNSISMKSSVDKYGKAGPAPSSSTELAEEASVQTGSWSGCIIDRSKDYDVSQWPAVKSKIESLYPRQKCSGSKLQSVSPLSTNFSIAKQIITDMKPNSLTNNTIGLQWGLEAFSPEEPLSGANPEANRIAILMTDGENTDSRWESSSGIDKRMKIACQNFRTLGITLYTINLVEGDQSLLQSCATSPDLFYDVDTASQLAPVFKEIAKRILPVRLMR